MKTEILKWSKFNFITSLPIIICWVVFLLFELFINLPQAIKHKKLIELEIAKLIPPENAILIENKSNNGSSKAAVKEVYNIDWESTDIFNYYYKGLIENGWNNNNKDEITFHNVGQEYCKGDYTLNIDYYHEDNEGFYSIWIFWGLSSNCDIKNGRNLSQYWMIIIYPIAIGLTIFLNIKYFGKYILK